MKLYSVKIRLSGSLYNEVRKDDVTAAEIAILRNFHGPDSVADIVETGDKPTNHDEERARLWQTYVGTDADASFGPDGGSKAKAKVLRDVLGHASTPLPLALPGKVEVAPAKPVRTRPAVKSGRAEDIAADLMA